MELISFFSERLCVSGVQANLEALIAASIMSGADNYDHWWDECVLISDITQHARSFSAIISGWFLISVWGLEQLFPAFLGSACDW